jgi:hypothetical protein
MIDNRICRAQTRDKPSTEPRVAMERFDSPMELSARQELYGDAYLHALAAVAGFGMAKPVPDDDSIDWLICARGPYETRRSPMIAVQIKCPFRYRDSPDTIGYPISLKNYDELRPWPLMVPRLLIVVTIPESIDKWIESTADGTILRNCAYWISLREAPTRPNKGKVTISIPKSQRQTAESLQALMYRAGASEPL